MSPPHCLENFEHQKERGPPIKEQILNIFSYQKINFLSFSFDAHFASCQRAIRVD